MSSLPKTKTEHNRNLRQLVCVVSETPFITLHHCHGGSMLEHAANPGTSQRQNDALQIPLAALYHVGALGIDTGMGKFKGVAEWEAEFGTQIEHLEQTSWQLGYDVWELYEKLK